jgi:cysteine-rich repeat protein
MMRTILLVVCLSALAAWACDASTRGDGVCDCGCGTVDPDCQEGFGACVRNHCPTGQVPWEHQPETCMTSACGDGWRDERSNEFCDDGDALPRGGCSADCKQVNIGFSCGDRAAGCMRTGDAGVVQAPDAGAGRTPDAGPPMESPMPRSSCASGPAWFLAPGLALCSLRRRASRR